MVVQAKVILTAINGNIFPPKRVIYLSPSKPQVTIGRASKSPSKAIHSSVDNAWFDSPVMSRDHARLSLDLESETLSIQDIGSMHGTQVNDTRLAKHAPMTIQDGDVIIFGTEVKRGSETFSACKFGFNYEFSLYRPANTFAFPESSDGDDEAKLNDSDSGRDVIALSSRQRQEPIKSSPDICQEVAQAVDHDRDSAFAVFSRIKPSDETRGKSEQKLQKPSESPLRLFGQVEQTEKSDMDTMSSSSVKNDAKDRFRLDTETYLSENLEADLLHRKMENTKAPNNEGSASGRVPEAWNFTSSISSKSCDSITNTNGDNLAETPVIDLTKSENELDSELQTPENDDRNGDSESSSDDDQKADEICLYPRPCGYNSLKENSKKADCKHNVDELYSISSNSIPSSPVHEDEMPLVHSEDTIISGSGKKCLDSCDEIIIRESFTQSDDDTLKGFGVDGGVYFNSDVRWPWDPLLAFKAGKAAYFKAREFNKAKYNSMGNLSEDPYTSYIFSDRNQPKSPPSVRNPKVAREQKHDFMPVSNERKKLYPKKISDFQRNLFVDPRDQKIFSGGSLVTGIRFDEFVETDFNTPSESESNKRKADVMSKDEGVKEKESYCSIPKFSKFSSGKMRAGKVFKAGDNVHRKPSPQIVSHDIHDARISKRQKVLERIQYMALGGVAAAAGLFSILVATAPEF